ncbi:MAG: hypothetical protein Fur0041_06480 [Bacteroidia bacterium]
MKTSVIPVIIGLLILCGAGGFAWWVFFHHERQLQIVEIPESYFTTSDTSRFGLQSLTIERLCHDDSILVVFPVTERKTEAFVYDAPSFEKMKAFNTSALPLSQPHVDLLKAYCKKPVINMSGYDPGKYYIHLTACNYAGFFEIEIRNR